MKTAIYSLYQRHELARVKCFLAQVVPVLSEQNHLHILINDYDCLDLREHTRNASPHISVYCEGRNLGVAGGRNYLIRCAVESGAEFLISCDIDIVYETHHFDRLRDAYTKLSKVDTAVGFLMPILFDGRKVRQYFPILHHATDEVNLYDRINANDIWRNSFWETVKEKCGKEQALRAIYHSGVSNFWKAHFGAPPDNRISIPWSTTDWTKLYRTTHSTLRSELSELERIIEVGLPVRISSCAGGVVAFHASLVDKAGCYDEIFNPFGYEDSEIGFRSTLSGHHNYLIPDVFAIHDIFMGEANRTLMSNSRIGLLRGVEVSQRAIGIIEYEFIVMQSLLYCWRDLVKVFGDQVSSCRMTTIEAEQMLPDFVVSYLFDFLRGAVHGLALYPAQETNYPLQVLLRGILEGDANVADFRIELGLNARFVAGNVICRKRIGETGRAIYSFFASNCRIEESIEAGKLTSRYFDIACVIRPTDGRLYSVTIDIQSNEETFSIEFAVELADEGAHLHGSAKIRKWKASHKRYKFGQFSVEDIYPEPTLLRSTGWLPMMQVFAEWVTTTVNIPTFHTAVQSLTNYLKLSQETPAIINQDDSRLPATRDRKRILVFTDSRGQHKPPGGEYLIFGERLAADDRLEVDLYLCPMKWTSTLDFLQQFPTERLTGYDAVVLYTGIVDWSPRPLSSAMHELYDNRSPSNEANLALNTRDYSKKIVNNKKSFFDKVFGEPTMAAHFAKPFVSVFEGERTINMYGIEMARRSLLPLLRMIPNLIFVSGNRLVQGWNGDYRRARPENIYLTHEYSDLFCDELANSARLVDLREWSEDDIKVMTCDNMHLTQRGSDYIYEQIMKLLDLHPTKFNSIPYLLNHTGGFKRMRPLERLIPAKSPPLLSAAKRRDFLATLVIGLRLDTDDDNAERLANLKFLLHWIEYHYGKLFDVLLMEQGTKPKIDLYQLNVGTNVRHQFINNPCEYNRGWGYNVAVRYFCEESDVVALMDTDVLTGANFVREIIDCHTKYDAITPYQNIYYSDAGDVQKIKASYHIDELSDISKIRNPVTLSGGILIIRRSVFLALKGFEQYVGYSCEDRAMDVTLFNHIDPERLRIAPETYVHLHHQPDGNARIRFKEIYDHLVTNYGCKYDPNLGPFDFIHKNCQHVPKSRTLLLMIQRATSFGDPDLYNYDVPPEINGIVNKRVKDLPVRKDVIYPTEFTSLNSYSAKELYKNAPEPDEEELAVFYNIFQGKRCFIIGNGPSLNKHDLSLLRNEYSFGVNSFYYKTQETGFRPTFYVVEDSSVMKENIEQIRRFDAPYKFFPTNYRSLHPKLPNTFFFRMNRGFYEKSSPNYVVPRFSTDATKGLYCGQSVTYINLQLAYFMGFAEVFLIGMDFDYQIPSSHKRVGDVLFSDTDDPNHFHKDYFGKGKTWKDPKLDRVLMNYNMARLVYECAGRKIYNATSGGKLEAFERVNYDGLFLERDKKYASEPLELTRPDDAGLSVAKVAVASTPAVSTPAAVEAPKAASASKPAAAPATTALNQATAKPSGEGSIVLARELADNKAWGNLVAFREPIDEMVLVEAVRKNLKLGTDIKPKQVPVAAEEPILHKDNVIKKETPTHATKPYTSLYRVSHAPNYKQLSERQWRYTQSNDPQRLWMAIINMPNDTAGRSFIGTVRLGSKRKITVKVVNARHGKTKYEGNNKCITLEPGIYSDIHVRNEYKHSHTALRLQIEVQNLEGVDTAELTIEMISMFETLDSIRKRIGENSIKLGDANRLFREGDYSTALGIYLLLNESNSFKLYANNALMSVRRLGMEHISTIDDLLPMIN